MAPTPGAPSSQLAQTGSTVQLGGILAGLTMIAAGAIALAATLRTRFFADNSLITLGEEIISDTVELIVQIV